MSKGFLARLARNQAGNVIALTAAAIFPVIGLVGGAVDTARLYAVKSRLQAACDAGALSGRRVMGTGRWTDNSSRANTQAEKSFLLNFPSGTFGSTGLTKHYSEVDGTVTGTASANVPMTLMRVFGYSQKAVAVTCEGTMRIPNTDVMFVLDNSGSMDQVIPGDTTGLKKMAGLQLAIRCFYEALTKENLTEVSAADCGTTLDPTGGLSSQVQLRFGFVNYDNMVNVGKLLPNDFMVDNWTYQSRRASQTETVQTWTVGSQSSTTWGNWSATPNTHANGSNYSNSYSVVSGNTTLADGVTYLRKATPTNSTACDALNTYGSYNNLVGITESTVSGSSSTDSWSGDTPVYPATEQNMTTTGRRTQNVTYGYRYRYQQVSGTWGCYLERASASTSGNINRYPQTRPGTATKPITWTSYDRVLKWTYQPVSFNVAGLKAGTSSWNSSVSLPVGRQRRTVYLSGSTSSEYIEVPINSTVAWEGCIEERQTFANTDGNPSDDWLNYPSSPTDAFDMDIDRVPTTGDARTQWRPLLPNAVWGRKSNLSGNSWSGSDTVDPVLADANLTSGDPSRNLSNNSCVTESRKLTNYNGRDGNPTAQNFSDYVGSLVKHNNTYHDIGLLWGARLMSPTGIFAGENATTPGGAQIQRHMIFMTDGDTANTWNNYASYGLEWWDRRQVDPTGINTGTFEGRLEANNNARSNALCSAIKNKGITLWVIYYGTSGSATKTRLTNCATSASYFFEASDTTLLIQKFREIADKISNLRLTN